MGHAERIKAVVQFRLEKKGFFGVVDPGLCIALFRDIGIDAVDLQNARATQKLSLQRASFTPALKPAEERKEM
eukprot:3791861-Pyramimonas_sp.AAC.1